jgi:2-(1,2-epoxy-1,2-dihydrophenyl)acetyl-CoA isomerase
MLKRVRKRQGGEILDSPLLTEKVGTCVILTMNRSDALNAFTGGMHRALLDALVVAGANPEVRSIILTGAGRGFCAGQDLAEASDPNGPVGSLGEHLEKTYNRLVRTIRRLPVPVIAAVNGVAAGAGANIALACDIVLAGRSAKFIQSFSKISLVPDSGGTWTLPRLVGLQRARALALLGDTLNAEQAQVFGMVWQVTDDDALRDAALAIAERIASLPPEGLKLTKRALDTAMETTFDRQLDIERDLQSLAGQSADNKEAVAAFLEKRPPVFGTQGATR